jgi:hypothetical protein
LLLLAAVVTLAGGCRQSRQAPVGDVVIELATPLFSPAVGPNEIRLRLVDSAGNPLDNALLHARADMAHAGMVPVFAEGHSAGEGVYRLPLEWTMAGDWIVTVDAELPDGRRANRQFPITVTGDNIYCTVDD